jgi:hypothetical protein
MEVGMLDRLVEIFCAMDDFCKAGFLQWTALPLSFVAQLCGAAFNAAFEHGRPGPPFNTGQETIHMAILIQSCKKVKFVIRRQSFGGMAG